MEPSQGRPLEPSRIPRPSRLPVLRDAANSLSRNTIPNVVDRKFDDPVTSEDVQIRRELVVEGRKTLENHAQTGQTDGSLKDGARGKNSSSQTLSTHRRPRPSLSDRTAETLAQIPSSTSPRKRRSSFFQSDSPMLSQRRFASSMTRARPSTSLELRPQLPDRLSSLQRSPEKPQLAPITGNSIAPRTPVKANAGPYVPRSLPPIRPGLDDVVQLTPSRYKQSFTNLRSNKHKPNFG